MTAVLAVEGVHKRFRDVHAVRGISFSVGEGEIFGLLGPNGAGKTTLIRMILDIYRPDSGSVHVFGHPLGRLDLDRIGYLPEERGLYKKRKVGQVLRYLGELKGMHPAEATEVAQRLLARVGLGDTAQRRIDTLSKGNQQKVQLVGTLIASPKLLVWDEPFSGLDPVAVRGVRALLREQAEAGTTVILSTHLMEQAETLCTRVGLVHRGELVLCGTLDELLQPGAEHPSQRPSLEEVFVRAVEH